ncbi:hypothetical protein DFJ74DRAFT_310677 [Hyaloraphidium curvatum]|nr:hypothetical protein DFJ74DRAFT_310677 [Hyaloraphidium curvatum]
MSLEPPDHGADLLVIRHAKSGEPAGKPKPASFPAPRFGNGNRSGKFPFLRQQREVSYVLVSLPPPRFSSDLGARETSPPQRSVKLNSRFSKMQERMSKLTDEMHGGFAATVVRSGTNKAHPLVRKAAPKHSEESRLPGELLAAPPGNTGSRWRAGGLAGIGWGAFDDEPTEPSPKGFQESSVEDLRTSEAFGPVFATPRVDRTISATRTAAPTPKTPPQSALPFTTPSGLRKSKIGSPEQLLIKTSNTRVPFLKMSGMEKPEPTQGEVAEEIAEDNIFFRQLQKMNEADRSLLMAEGQFRDGFDACDSRADRTSDETYQAESNVKPGPLNVGLAVPEAKMDSAADADDPLAGSPTFVAGILMSTRRSDSNSAFDFGELHGDDQHKNRFPAVNIHEFSISEMDWKTLDMGSNNDAFDTPQFEDDLNLHSLNGFGL